MTCNWGCKAITTLHISIAYYLITVDPSDETCYYEELEYTVQDPGNMLYSIKLDNTLGLTLSDCQILCDTIEAERNTNNKRCSNIKYCDAQNKLGAKCEIYDKIITKSSPQDISSETNCHTSFKICEGIAKKRFKTYVI